MNIVRPNGCRWSLAGHRDCPYNCEAHGHTFPNIYEYVFVLEQWANDQVCVGHSEASQLATVENYNVDKYYRHILLLDKNE